MTVRSSKREPVRVLGARRCSCLIPGPLDPHLGGQESKGDPVGTGGSASGLSLAPGLVLHPVCQKCERSDFIPSLCRRLSSPKWLCHAFRNLP